MTKQELINDIRFTAHQTPIHDGKPKPITFVYTLKVVHKGRTVAHPFGFIHNNFELTFDEAFEKFKDALSRDIIKEDDSKFYHLNRLKGGKEKKFEIVSTEINNKQMKRIGDDVDSSYVNAFDMHDDMEADESLD